MSRHPTEDFGYRVTWGAIRAFAVCFCIGALILWLANTVIDGFGWRAFDATDDAVAKERSGLRIYYDHGTGCQYLATTEGQLTPRLGRDRQPICAEGGQ